MDNQFRGAVLLLDNLLIQQTIPADQDAYNQLLESDFASQQAQGASLFRSCCAGSVGSGSAVLNPVLTAYTHHIVNTPERAPQAALDRMYAYFNANGKTVQSRNINYGAIPSFGVDKGQLYRCVVDENAYPLENEFVETKTLRCIRDENTGAERFREVFEIRGGNAGIDGLDANESGAIRRDLQAKDSSSSLLANSAFSQYSIAGAFAAGRYDLISTDTITGWELNDPTGFALSTLEAEQARNIVGDPTPTSVVAKPGALRTMTQAFSVNRLQISADSPYLPEIWVIGGAGLTTGEVRLRWGTQTATFALSAVNVGARVNLVAARDEKLWAAVFNEQNATFIIEVENHDAEVILDELRFNTMEPFDGTWWHLSGSFDEKFLLDDQVAVADTLVGSDSKIQKWLWRTYGRYLPHAPVATQVVASGGRTLTFAAGLTVTASSGDFTADGYQAGQQLTVSGTASNDGTYLIDSVAATVITITGGPFVAEGPLSGGETLDGGPSVTDPT